MKIIINDKPCEAQVGDRLLDVAQQNKAHIGYICGGSGICQSCFIYVEEGMECLSTKGDTENAFISDVLAQAGGRLACRTTIIKEGNIRILTRAEQLRRTVLGLNVPGFVSYAQTIGYNVVNQLPKGIGDIVGRARKGQLDPVKSLQHIAQGIGHATLLIGNTIFETVPLLNNAASAVTSTAGSALSMVTGSLGSLTEAMVPKAAPAEEITRVQIRTSPKKKS